MPALRRILRRSVAVLSAVAVAGGAAIVTSSSENTASAADVLGAGGEFHPLAPERVLDTRAGLNVDEAGPRPLVPGSGQAFDVPLSGMGGLPDMIAEDQVLAVAVSITVVEPTERGYLRAFGTGNAEAESSIVNFNAGETVPNMTVLAPGTDGEITVRLVSEAGDGAAHVLIDVFGWFSKGTYTENGSRLIPVGPGRIFDSRNPDFGEPAPLGPGGVVQVPIAGADSLNPAIDGIVPDRGTVDGVLLNITGVNQGPNSAPTFVSVVPERPAEGTAPDTSNLNLVADQVKANLVMVPVGTDGSVWLYNSAGATDLVVDVVGYLEPRDQDTREGRVIPLVQPSRVLDTRADEVFGPLPLGPGRADDWSFCNFVGTVTIGEEWVGPQSAFLGNLTATGLERREDWFDPAASYLTVYPATANDQEEPPEASNLNIFEDQSVPNAALFRYGERPRDDGSTDEHAVRVYNYNHSVHYLVDAAAVILTDEGADEADPPSCGGS